MQIVIFAYISTKLIKYEIEGILFTKFIHTENLKVFLLVIVYNMELGEY